MSVIEVLPFTIADSSDLQAHLQRHRAESGKDGMHFMPFDPVDPDVPKTTDLSTAFLPLDKPGWRRWFYARDAGSGLIVGNVDIRNDGLKTALHRCELGIGVERAYRSAGLGKRLMMTAIKFARDAETLAWIDLCVFSNNTQAHALYKQLGFTEVGTVKDRFRIGDDSIDDIAMVLHVK